jgi:hypothetical protein
MGERMIRKGLLTLGLLGLVSAPAFAVPITVDEILYDSTTNPAYLSGTVDMALLGNTLTITLTNTSANAAGSGAGILLTGIGFQLPSGILISTGTANMGTSTAVNFTKPASGNVSSEWGYDNNPLNSGMFQGGAALSYNTVVSSMVSMTTSQFASGSLGQPPNLGGPDFGLVSANETDSLGSGIEGIRSSLIISLNLSGVIPANLISQIQAGNVGLSFGSPNSTTHQVPEPTSLSLLSAGIVSLGVLVRRRQQRR